MNTDPNKDILSNSGGDWLHRWIIPPLMPGVRVHLIIDSPDAQPREDCVNVFLSIEPPAIDPRVHSLLRNPHWCAKWDVIGCADPSVVALQEKAKRYIHSPFWVDPPEPNTLPKLFGISTIMSSKMWTDGHRLRHWIRENWPSVPGKVFYGSQCSSPEELRQPYPRDRRDCFRFMFHLVIENCRSNGYFTEKLMDCLRCRCVPLYWGDPKIGEVFDTNGIILIGDMSPPEILNCMRQLTVDDYNSRLSLISKNALIAEEMSEGDNPHPLYPDDNPGKCNRLGRLLLEAQLSYSAIKTLKHPAIAR